VASALVGYRRGRAAGKRQSAHMPGGRRQEPASAACGDRGSEKCEQPREPALIARVAHQPSILSFFVGILLGHVPIACSGAANYGARLDG
jgi:hypothetical protein